jgi:hypothetical protein
MLWAAAQRAAAPGRELHGLPTVADIMRGLNPLRGQLYREALDVTRTAREIASLMLGKYPHPSTIFPGGLGIDATPAVFNQVWAGSCACSTMRNGSPRSGTTSWNSSWPSGPSTGKSASGPRVSFAPESGTTPRPTTRRTRGAPNGASGVW